MSIRTLRARSAHDHDWYITGYTPTGLGNRAPRPPDALVPDRRAESIPIFLHRSCVCAAYENAQDPESPNPTRKPDNAAWRSTPAPSEITSSLTAALSDSEQNRVRIVHWIEQHHNEQLCATIRRTLTNNETLRVWRWASKRSA